jgi:hypothetical protein
VSYVESAGVTTRWTNNVVTGSAAIDTGTVETTLTFGSAAAAGNASGVLSDADYTILGGAGSWGDRLTDPYTTFGDRVRAVTVPAMQFPTGMGPFFSTVLPDGTIAMPQIQLAVSQVATTGTTMSCAFFHPDQGFYVVTVPTSLGQTDTYAVNGITGVVSTAGGADLSDSTLTWDGDTPVLYCLSALSYRGWRMSTIGLYPFLPAFTLNGDTGRWEYNAGRSIWPATLRASHVNGPDVFPNRTNFYSETYTDTLLPAEIVTLPRSGHIAVAVYGPRAGHNWGSIITVDPVTKTMKAWYEWPDMLNAYGWGSRAFTRDINADPTSVANDERIALNFDLFMQPNETFNVIVFASGGTWRVNYGGTNTSALAVGATAAELQAALGVVVGSGNLTVRETRPFLVSSYVVYEVELIGTLAHTDLTATSITVDTASLTGNGGTIISRWRHGGTGYTAQVAFPFVEVSYDANAGTITPKTVPMLPQTGTEDPVRGEQADASAGMTWYTSNGDLAVAVSGWSPNPNIFTQFSAYGLHIWRSAGVGVDRAYVAMATPTTGWESRYGEARPAPDFVTRSINSDGGTLQLGLAEDQATGSLVIPGSNGKLLTVQPHGRWQSRSGRLWRPGTFASTADVTGTYTAGSGHAIAYNGTETAMQWTAASTADGVIGTATGTAGVSIPSDMIGDVLIFRVEAKAATTRRLIRMAVRFWGSGGGEVGSLTGYGAAVSYDSTTGYRWFTGSALIPTGTAYLSFHIEILKPGGAGEVHYIRTVDVRLAPFYTTPAIRDTGISPLYVDQPGGSWAAKGFVDPETRMLWVPYLQVVDELTARNHRFPSWLTRVNMASLFPLDRRPPARVYTAALWRGMNPVLEVGEVGEETDTGLVKVGNGTTAWADLGYGGADGGRPT